jgi:hypothetical protein
VAFVLLWLAHFPSMVSPGHARCCELQGFILLYGNSIIMVFIYNPFCFYKLGDNDSFFVSDSSDLSLLSFFFLVSLAKRFAILLIFF